MGTYLKLIVLYLFWSEMTQTLWDQQTSVHGIFEAQFSLTQSTEPL